MRFDLILTMREIYINSNLNPLIKFTSGSRSNEFKDMPLCHRLWGNSKMITKIVSINMRIAISYAMKWGILF